MPIWKAAIDALPGLLREFATGAGSATVIISNHFVRYAVVPWRDEVTNQSERLALAKHCFRSIYGKSAGDWDVRLSDDGFRRNALASAIDRPLVDALGEAFLSSGIKLESIQPYFMSACNRFRRELAAHRSACFAVVEEGRATVAIYDAAGWRALSGRRLMDGRAETLWNVVMQETQSFESPEIGDQLVVAALGDPRMEVPAGKRAASFLHLAARPGFSPYEDANAAMALCGAIG
jgi:hypothetical protein